MLAPEYANVKETLEAEKKDNNVRAVPMSRLNGQLQCSRYKANV